MEKLRNTIIDGKKINSNGYSYKRDVEVLEREHGAPINVSALN